jgi:hypothetical protein
MNTARVLRRGVPNALLALRPQLAVAAQEVLDEWVQDENGEDVELGTGGACDVVARAMGAVLASSLPNADVEDGGQDGDDHAFLLVNLDVGVFVVDIPPSVYERGAGYSWRKIPGVVVTPDDVVIERL